MKKASKLLWALLSLAMAAFMLGCPTDAGGEEEEIYRNPSAITTDWQLFYVKIRNNNRPSNANNLTGLERLHFHHNSTAENQTVGIEIEKIFATSAPVATPNALPADAQIIADFTLGTTEAEWGVTTNGDASVMTSEAAFWTFDGQKAKLQSTIAAVEGYNYLGNIGFTAPTALYVGFKVRNVSADITGEIIKFGGDGETLTCKGIYTLAQWFGNEPMVAPPPPPPAPPVAVEDWTAVYYELTDVNTNVIGLHVENGSVQIQKIFVNDSESTEGATMLFDFTAETVSGENIYNWGETAGANSFTAGIANGQYTLAGTGDYVPGGRFGSDDLKGGSKYLGFIIKSEDLGNVRFLISKDVDGSVTDLATVRFDEILPLEWVTGYYEITDPDTEIMGLHVENGSVQIQKIFVNDSESAEGATVLFDFSVSPIAVDASVYEWGAASFDTGVANGVYTLAGTGDYVPGGRFGSSDLKAQGSFIGVVMKSRNYGNTRFLLQKADESTIATVLFDSLLPAEE